MRLRPYYAVPRSEWLRPPGAAGRVPPELEALRQWMLAELAVRYGYPRDWLRERAEFVGPEHAVAGMPSHFFGLRLVTAARDPFLLIALQRGRELREAESVLRAALASCPFARLGLASDGTRAGTRCLRWSEGSTQAERVRDIEPFTVAAPAPRRRAPETATRNGRSQTIAVSLDDIVFEAHSHIRDIDGLHADESLDELCKVLYARLFDERTHRAGRPHSFRRRVAGTTEECAATVRRMYRDAAQSAGSHGACRGVFDSPIRLSSPALARVVESLEACRLVRPPADMTGRAFQRVLAPALRAGMGQYFTPPEVVDLIVEAVDPRPGERLIDPFAGSGHFLARALDHVRARHKTEGSSPRRQDLPIELHGIEKSDRMVRIATASFGLSGDAISPIRCGDALLDFHNYGELREGSFDLVLTNPPFGSLLGPDAVARLGRFELAAGRRSVPLEVLGLERSVQWLRPGGRLGIVLPDGVLANPGMHRVREWLADSVKLRAVVSLPVEAFAAYGANVKTSLLIARKWRADETRRDDYRVCLAAVEDIAPKAAAARHGDVAAAAAAIRAFLDTDGW